MTEPHRPPVTDRLVAWLAADRKRRWWVLVLFVAALLVRLRWNLSVHPLDQFIYSDMKGYIGRADALLDSPFSVREYDAFFPFGTTWLLAAIKLVFGRDNITAIAVVFAMMGAAIVSAGYAIADRVLGDRTAWAAPIVGLFLLVYYPLVAIGGYLLSELPFCFCLTFSVLFLIRLVDEGRSRDAWLLGVALGCGALVRPQMTVTMGLLGLLWLATRWARGNPYTKLGWPQLIRVGVPILLLLTMASVRLHIHTGRYGLVSENGTINLVFGRCHNKGIYSRRDDAGHGTVRFSPPPLIQFEAYSQANPDSWFKTRSVWGDHPEHVPGVPGFAVDEFGCTRRPCRQPGSEIEYRGYIGDRDIQMKLVRACIERGGLGRQAYFTLSHWMLLYRFNLMWPDQANPRPRSTDPDEGWRNRQEVWLGIHRGVLMVPSLLGLAFMFVPRRRPKQALVAISFFALIVVVGIWLGDIRLRVPYDPIIVVLAMCTYVEAIAWVRARVRARRATRAPARASGAA
jgi:hypothetical protein